jgi:hypothetical protein
MIDQEWGKFENSYVDNGKGESTLSAERTSAFFYIRKGSDAAVRSIEAR